VGAGGCGAAPRRVGSAQPAVALLLSLSGPPSLADNHCFGSRRVSCPPEKAPTDFSLSLHHRVPREYVLFLAIADASFAALF